MSGYRTDIAPPDATSAATLLALRLRSDVTAAETLRACLATGDRTATGNATPPEDFVFAHAVPENRPDRFALVRLRTGLDGQSNVSPVGRPLRAPVDVTIWTRTDSTERATIGTRAEVPGASAARFHARCHQHVHAALAGWLPSSLEQSDAGAVVQQPAEMIRQAGTPLDVAGYAASTATYTVLLLPVAYA